MTISLAESFPRLLACLQLREIRPVSLHADRLGDPSSPTGEMQIKIEHAFADDDPFLLPDGLRIFRPKFTASVTQGPTGIFRQESIFIVGVAVSDEIEFTNLWSDPALRTHFTENQLRHTIWPLFRQHVLDGMSRVGLPAVTLPWVTG